MEVAPMDTQSISDTHLKGTTHGFKQDVLLVPIAERWQHGFMMYWVLEVFAPYQCSGYQGKKEKEDVQEKRGWKVYE
jgi:hypothetical protein